MPIFEIFSRRKRRERGEPDVYQYTQIPRHLRVQVCYILDSALGPYADYYDTYLSHRQNNDGWRFIHETLCREKGLEYLACHQSDLKKDCLDAVCTTEAVDDWLDIVEFCFRHISNLAKVREGVRSGMGIKQDPEDAVKELNFRLREAGFGYQFEGGQIIRVDSQYVHAEVVKPALFLLGDPRFSGAQEEFLSAHAHYRAGEHEDAIVDANRAFESTMKTICDIKRWQYPKGARASDLVRVVRANGLLPDYLDQSFDQLIATLKSGLPQVRDEAGGHGQGAARRRTPACIAGYALHLAAANIVLLGEALNLSE